MTGRLSSICFAALMLFVAGRCLVPMDETDLFFNLRLGQIVLETGSVPTTNLLSFTWPDHRDVNLAWVFQVILALAHRAGGVPGTVVLKTIFVLATLAVLWRVALARGAHPALAAAALALAAWAGEPRFVERPHLVTFLGLALLLLALERAEKGRPRGLWLFVPGAVLWANANSCLFEASAVLLLYALGTAIEAHRAKAPEDPAADLAVAKRAALVGLAMAPLILATPSHVHALGYIANHIRMPWLRPLQEYRTAEWPLDGPFVFLTAALVLGVAAAPARVRWRVLLPAVAVGILGWRRIRFVAEFALLAGPAVAVAWTELVSGRRIPRRMADRARELVPMGTWAAALGLATLAIWPRASAARAGGAWFDIQIDRDLVPLAAIGFLEEEGLRDRLYNDLEVGSYLTWDGWPKHRVFQDPRINGYPDEFHAILRRKDLAAPEWEALLDRYGIEAALITFPGVNPRAALFPHERWAPVYRDKDALVFVKRRSEAIGVVSRNEMPLSFTYTEDEGTMVHPLETQPGYSPVRSCEWHRRLGDFYLEQGSKRTALKEYRIAVASGMECIDRRNRQALMITMAGLQMRLSGPADAVDLLTGLPDPTSRTNRGFALMALRRVPEALEDFDGALKLDPGNLEAMFGRGICLHDLGRRTDAMLALQKFLQAAPPDHVGAKEAQARLDRLMTSR